MRTTPISQKERKRMHTLGWVLDIGQGILTVTVAAEIINEIIDVFIYVGLLAYMRHRKILTKDKVIKLTLVFAAEEVPGLDLFWFWSRFTGGTLYDGVPEEGQAEMEAFAAAGNGSLRNAVVGRRSPQRPPPLNSTPGIRLPRK